MARRSQILSVVAVMLLLVQGVVELLNSGLGSFMHVCHACLFIGGVSGLTWFSFGGLVPLMT